MKFVLTKQINTVFSETKAQPNNVAMKFNKQQLRK